MDKLPIQEQVDPDLMSKGSKANAALGKMQYDGACSSFLCLSVLANGIKGMAGSSGLDT